MKNEPRFIISILALVSVFTAGTVGFHLLEGWSFFDSFYMCLITITTIGYMEVHNLSDGGRVLNSVIILLGVGTFTYTITQLVHVLIQQELRVFFKVRAMEKDVGKMQGHFIVCGAGRLGFRIVRHLQEASRKFVVVETDTTVITKLVEMGVHSVVGDATDDDVLKRAGIERAKGLVTATGDDPQNVYIVLTARALNPLVYIVSRANSMPAESKLRRAGADRVVSPERIGSRQMADALLRPAVLDFFDDVMESSEVRVNMDAVTIHKGSQLDGVALKDARLPDRAGVHVIRIQRADGETMHRPSGETLMTFGDHLVVVGDSDALNRLKLLCGEPIKD